MNCVREKQSHAYIIKHPISTQLTPCDGIHSHQVQWHYTCIDSVSARAAQLEDGWSPNELCEGEQSHAYIIKHPIETQLTPCDGIHSHQVQWHYYVYWFGECQSSTTGGRMVSKWIVWGRAVSCLHNQAPNWNTIDFLRWNTLTSGTVTLLRVLILWVPEQHNWGMDGLQMNCVREAVSCLHNQAPNLNTNWLLVMEYTHIRYSDITTCIDSVSARAAQLEDGWSPNELYEGDQSHAYIIKHPIETQLTSCDGNTLTSGTVTLLRVLILWVPEQHNWRTDGLQMNWVRESSLMLT